MMMVKITPEWVRLLTALAAGTQVFAAALAGTDVLPVKALIVIVAVGSSLNAMLAAYTQGVQTNPPQGMLTEERAKQLSEPVDNGSARLAEITQGVPMVRSAKYEDRG